VSASPAARSWREIAVIKAATRSVDRISHPCSSSKNDDNEEEHNDDDGNDKWQQQNDQTQMDLVMPDGRFDDGGGGVTDRTDRCRRCSIISKNGGITST
jgi:hypothetical protein